MQQNESPFTADVHYALPFFICFKVVVCTVVFVSLRVHSLVSLQIQSMMLFQSNRLSQDLSEKYLNLSCIMSQNGQTHFKNLAVNAAKFLNYVLLFWDIMH